MKAKTLVAILVIATLFTVVFSDQSATSRSQALKKFQKWYFDTLEGQKAYKLELRMLPDGSQAGVFATEDIKINEATQLSEVDSEVEFNDDEVLAFYIWYIKYCEPEVNPWDLWADSLPSSFSNVYYFSEDDISRLTGSAFRDRAVSLQNKNIQFFENIKTIVQKHPAIFETCSDIDYSQWKWASSVVLSRKIELLDEKKKTFSTIVPFFDFMNHVDNNMDKYTWGFKKFFHTEALKAFKKGEEVVRSYGEFSNAKLLEMYGFVLPTNSHDSVLIDIKYLGIDPEDPLESVKLGLIEEYRNKKAGNLILMGNGVSQELLEAAKIINGGEKDFVDGKLKKRVSVLTEVLVARWFQAVAQTKLDEYETDLKTNEAFVKSAEFAKLSPISQMIELVKVGEKKILHQAIETFAAKEQRLLRPVQQKKDKHDEL